jgi:hypothetical protein
MEVWKETGMVLVAPPGMLIKVAVLGFILTSPPTSKDMRIQHPLLITPSYQRNRQRHYEPTIRRDAFHQHQIGILNAQHHSPISPS